jgi:hypothetical protein
MTEVSIHVSELKARIASKNDLISTADESTECQRLCNSLQLDRNAHESKSDQILGPVEYADCGVINGPAEPQVSRAEPNRTRPKKERRGKNPVTSPLYVHV